MLIKKALILTFFLNLFFPVNAAVNITDLVQAITIDEKNDNGESSNQIIFNVTNTANKPVTLAIEVHLAKFAEDGHLEIGEETEDFQIVPEFLTVDPGDTSLVTACFDADTPKKETVYMVGFRYVNVDVKNQDEMISKEKIGIDIEHVIYALVYVRTSDMKAKITDVKYLGNGKIAVTNVGTRTAIVGEVKQELTVDGVTKRLSDFVVSSDLAIFAGTTRILPIDRSKFEFKVAPKSVSKKKEQSSNNTAQQKGILKKSTSKKKRKS